MKRCRLAISCGLALWIVAATVASGQQAAYTGWTEDVVVRQYVPWYGGPVNDGPATRPFPPSDLIPPVPMPDAREAGRNPFPRGAVLYHDALAGETFEIASGLDGTGTVPGFRGVDGREGWGESVWRVFNDMVKVEDTAEFPWRINAKAVIRRGNVSTTCSAALLDAEVALLAGHCIYNQQSGWADEVFIVPAWDGQGVLDPIDAILNPYGWAHGTSYIVGADWVTHGDVDYDMGAVMLTRAAGMLTGWFGRAWGGTCAEIQGRTYHNASYPADSCHNGLDMYYWFGSFDSCPGNLLQINTNGGCFNEVWPGMSGSNAYFIESGERYSHAVCSHKNGATIGRYCKMWQGFNTGLTLFIDVARGSELDIQPLSCTGSNTTVRAGQTLDMAHLSVNATNFDPPELTYTYTWYLSDNEFITTDDTPLTTRSTVWDHGAMSAATFVSSGVRIPANTPAGTYWIGVIYDDGTDDAPENNAATTWDAHRVTVTTVGLP